MEARIQEEEAEQERQRRKSNGQSLMLWRTYWVMKSLNDPVAEAMALALTSRVLPTIITTV